jgi:hypothetical protein
MCRANIGHKANKPLAKVVEIQSVEAWQFVEPLPNE